MTNWAAIVYGRTYEIDFRILALPRDFTQSEQDWLIAHIQTMTRYPEELSNQPRWAVFRQDRLCVFMVACMARDLGEYVQPEGIDLTHDQRGRALYTVVGYATRVSPEESVQLPAYLDRDLKKLSSTYQEYVAAHWQVKSYIQDRATATEYQPLYIAPAMAPVELDHSYFALNTTEPNTVLLWPDAIHYRQALWATAAQQLATGQIVSLCLGLPTQGSAVNGAFLNGTSVDAAQKKEIRRIPEGALTPIPTNGEQSALSSPSMVTRRQAWIITPLLVAGSLIGGATGLLVSKSLEPDIERDKLTTEQAPLTVTTQKTKVQSEKTTTKMALYSGIGAIAGGLLSLVFGRLLIKKIADPISSDTSVNRKQTGQENALNQTSTQQDPMFGFREKDQQNEDQKDDDIMKWG